MVENRLKEVSFGRWKKKGRLLIFGGKGKRVEVVEVWMWDSLRLLDVGF